MSSFKDKLMRRGSNLEVGANLSAQSSSSTVDSIGAKRLSAVPEKDSNAIDIDIEQAIMLLQELKKTASPNELVALHRALLPMKDAETVTVTSPKTSTFDERATFSPPPTFQRRSALPPGLATRGGLAEDLLRKPGETSSEPPKQKVKPQNRTGWFSHGTSASVSSLAALDLADDATNPVGARAATPSDFAHRHMGAYQHGTLRVTNGAASPEPSLALAISHELPHELGAMEEHKADDGYFTCSSGRPSLDTIRGRVSIDVLPGRMTEQSLPIRDRILSSGKGQQQRVQRAQRLSAISTPSQDSLVSQLPLQVTARSSRQSMERDCVSPMSDCATPRWQQRTSHRASQISAEYVSDCDLTTSPYDEKNNNSSNALLNFATRLSTVYDSDPDDADDDRGTPEAALSMLTGDAGHLKVYPSDEIGSARTSNEQIQLPRVIQAGRRPPPRKVDSGYGSDASFQRMRRSASTEAGPSRKPYIAIEKGLNEVEERDENASIADTQSLYTFEEMLKSPSLLREAATPSPSSVKSKKNKKSSPLLLLHTLKSERRPSLDASPSSFAQGSTDTITTIASTESSPAEKKAEQIVKQQKKLQKPMPAAIKKQRKEEMRKLKEVKPTGLPSVPDEVSAAHAQRLSEEPLSAALNHTYATVGTTNSHEDLNGTPIAEMIGDVKFPSPVPSLAETKGSRRRSKSRGRKRNDSVRPSTSGDDSPEVQRSWSFSKMRSMSRSRSKSQKRSSLDATMDRSFLTAEQTDSPVSPGDENVPAWTDFSSVARTLGGGSYDISTNQFKRTTAPVPGAVQHMIQSPFMISTGLIKSKSMKGMNSEMASELARMKSRDFAHPSMEPWQDRPRMAIPPRSKSKDKSRSSSGGTPAPGVSVEDRFPDWQGKPASRNNSPQRAPLMHKSHSMYADIPPMPELPADVVVKVSKADEMVAKKLRDSARSTPAASARNSADVEEQRKLTSANKKFTQSPQHSEPKVLVDEKTLEILNAGTRPVTKRAHTINVQVREVNGSGSSLDLSTPSGGEEQVPEEEEEPIASPTHNARHSGWPGWEQQAKLWRQRRESLGEQLGKPVAEDEDTLPTADSPPISRKTSIEPSKSPAIVVSRYITPVSRETAARANAGLRPTDRAAQHADAYRDLLIDEKENRPAKPDVPRTDSNMSAASTSTFVTVKTWDPRPVKQDVPRTDSAASAQTYRTAMSTVTTTASVGRPSGRHIRTVSGKYLAYSPSKQELAEQSRAQSLAQLTGASPPANASTQSLGWLSGPANASTSSLGTPSRPRPRKSSPDSAVPDRYSGGLGYGWDRTAGFSGSAGTRHSGSEGKRKSVHMSESYGLDLSDVPVFLQKAV